MVDGTVTTWVPLLGAGILIALGLLTAVRPGFVANFVGLTPKGSLGRAELRATYGGIFTGGGVACLLLQSPDAYLTIAATAFMAAFLRTLSIGLDGATSRDNLVGVVFEVGIGALLLVGVA